MKNFALLTGTFVLFVLVCLSISCRKPPPEPQKPKLIPTFVMDIDSNIYNVKRFENKLWMTENLKVTRYDTESPRSGDTVSNAQQIKPAGIQTPYYTDARDFTESPYTDGLTNEIRRSLGLLYNWSAAAGTTENNTSIGEKVQGICPNGWRLPTSADFDNLCSLFGGKEKAGSALKSAYGWFTIAGTNESEMNCYPAGLATGNWLVSMMGQQTMFWTSKNQIGNNTKAEVLRLFFNQDKAEVISVTKIQANSVRCVMDLDSTFVGF